MFAERVILNVVNESQILRGSGTREYRQWVVFCLFAERYMGYGNQKADNGNIKAIDLQQEGDQLQKQQNHRQKQK